MIASHNWLLTALAGAALSLFALPARAARPPTPTEATLATGSPLPGTVTAVRVGIDVTVRLPDGSYQTLPWSEIHVATPENQSVHVQVSAGPANNAVDATNNAVSEFSRTPRDGDAPLLIESVGAPLAISAFDQPGTQSSSTDTSLRAHARFLCATPCTLYASPGSHSVHMAGDGLVERDVSVVLDEGGTRVRLRAASGLRVLGALGSIVYGAPAALGGIAFLAGGISGATHGGVTAGSCSASVSGGGASASYSSSDGCDAGFMLGVGIGLTATGGAMLALGGHLAATSGSGLVDSTPLALARASRGPRWLARVHFMGAGVARSADGHGAMGEVGVTF